MISFVVNPCHLIRREPGVNGAIKQRSSLVYGALACLLTLTSPLLADTNEWTAIGSATDSQAAEDNAFDEWQEIGGTPDADNDKWAAITQPRGDLSSTLLPISDVPQDALLIGEPEQLVVVPSIIEFGSEGSSVGVPESSDVGDDSQELLEPIIRVANLDMFVGELKVMGKVDVTRVAIGNGGIIRAEILKTGELLVIAQAAGSTSLRLWNKDESQSDYNIRVSEEDQQTRVHMERMVRMRVRMVEFRKTALGNLGIDWGASANGPTFAAAGDAIGNNLFRPAAEGFSGLPNRVEPFSTYFGIASQVTSKINFLARNGDAVILAEPVLSAMNGGSASFLAGGEVPFPAIGENGQAVVDFKEYGIKLNVAPQIDSGGNVRTFIETEISQLDAASAVNGTPGLLTRRAQTEFNVQSGQTIVISGLLSSESGSDVNYIPGLGRLPIIGRFFSSKSRTNTVTELVIFVTPEVIEPGDTGNVQRERERYDETNTLLRQARQQLPLME